MSHFGNIDICSSNVISGWVWDSDKPNESLKIEIFNNNILCEVLEANVFGPDLKIAQKGNGKHRFILDLTNITADGLIHEFYVKVSNSDYILPSGKIRVIAFSEDIIKGMNIREFLAYKYIKGKGIEVGALSNPQILPKGVEVKYIDRYDNKGLYKHYSELSEQKFVNIDIIDNGEVLSKIESNSQDFVIANHFLEHCENPINTIQNFLRVLKASGIMYITIPQATLTDKERKITDMEHFFRDFEKGPEISRNEHYDDWVEKVMNISKESSDFKRQSNKLMKSNYSIHFHVFDEFSIVELLVNIKTRLNLPIRIETIVNNNYQEIVIIVSKSNI